MPEELKQSAQRLDDDVRNLSKWLNEEITAPIDSTALARVLQALTQRPAAQEEGGSIAASLGDIVALWDQYAPSEHMTAIHMQAKRALAGQQPVSPDMARWCAYVGGMVAHWVTSEPDAHARLGVDRFEAAIAGIIERRLWAMPKPATQQATPERHLTVTTNQQGEAVMVSWQDDEHRILEVVWERKQATPEPVAVSIDACAAALFESDKSMWMSGPTFSDLHERDKERCRVMARAVMVCDARGLEFAGWSGVNPRSGSVEMCAHTPSPSVIRDFNMRPVFFGGTTKLDAKAAPEPVGEPVAWRWMPSHVFPTWVYSDDQNRVADARRFMGDGGVQALYTRPAPGVPEGWRNVIAGTLKTDPWDSARVADYNSGWNDCQRKTLRGLERLAAAQAKGAGHE